MMSETMITALISAGATLLVTMITQLVTVFLARFKCDLEIRQIEYRAKRENLKEVYKTLISVITLFPDISPNDVLKCVEYPPGYSVEQFDLILKILDYQIEDYKEQLKIPNIVCERKSKIETQILNREYSKKAIAEIRDKYYKAKDEYKIFCESDKIILELYAGQEVRNCLVEFDGVIHNIFISGYSVGTADDPMNNIIKISRRNLVNSMRRDIGIV